MRKAVVRLFIMLLLISFFLALSAEPQNEKKTGKSTKQDRSHTAIMSLGTYSSPMSWDRKTSIITQTGRVVAEEIYAQNKKFYAYADFAANRTTVFGIVRQGSIDRRAELWSMPGCHEMLGLSSDGNRLILGCRMEDQSIIGSNPEGVILTFIEKGDVIREICLEEIVTDWSKISGTGVSHALGRYRRLNPAGYYIVEMMDKTPLLFDLQDGEKVEIRLDRTGDIEGWLRYVDVFNWFEFQHPGDCSINEHKDFEGYPTGSLTLRRGNTGWAVTTDLEKIAVYRTDEKDRDTFLDFVIERAKAMNCADGPTSSSYAESIISQSLFTNPQGIEVVELLLSIKHSEWTEEEEMTEWSTRGPIYAVLLAPCPDEPRRVLFVSPAYGADLKVGETDLLKKIVETIKYPE
jgi:hypothetical protein